MNSRVPVVGNTHSFGRLIKPMRSWRDADVPACAAALELRANSSCLSLLMPFVKAFYGSHFR